MTSVVADTDEVAASFVVAARVVATSSAEPATSARSRSVHGRSLQVLVGPGLPSTDLGSRSVWGGIPAGSDGAFTSALGSLEELGDGREESLLLPLASNATSIRVASSTETSGGVVGLLVIGESPPQRLSVGGRSITHRANIAGGPSSSRAEVGRVRVRVIAVGTKLAVGGRKRSCSGVDGWDTEGRWFAWRSGVSRLDGRCWAVSESGSRSILMHDQFSVRRIVVRGALFLLGDTAGNGARDLTSVGPSERSASTWRVLVRHLRCGLGWGDRGVRVELKCVGGKF